MVLATSLCRRAACRLSSWATLVSLLAASLIAALAQAQHTSAIVSLLSGPWDEPDPFELVDLTDDAGDGAPKPFADGAAYPSDVDYGAIIDDGAIATAITGFAALGELLDGDTAEQLRDELPRRRFPRAAAPRHPSHGRGRARRPALDRR